MKTMMTRRGSNVFPIAAGVLGSVALAIPALADFINVDIQELDLGAPEGFVTYRVIAHFDGPDIALMWGSFGPYADLRFYTGNEVNLLNAGGPFDGFKAEDFATFPIAEEYDSYVTVGATGFANNHTNYSPGFLGGDGVHRVIEGHEFSDSDAIVINTDPTSPMFGPDVVLAQFTIPGIPGGQPGDKGHNGLHLEGVIVWNPPNIADFIGPFNVDLFVVDNIVPVPCPWDLDGDGTVGAIDLLTLLVAWGPQPPCHPADFDCSGNVGAYDLLQVLVNWGLCP